MEIWNQLAEVVFRIDNARSAALSPAHRVELVAVSKGQGEAAIRAAIAAGQRRFGENRVQEALGKWPTLKQEFPDIRLHLIGPLQTNKIDDALALFDVIETVDRPKLAQALAAALKNYAKPLSLFVQVNTGEEPQKAGVLPQNADALMAQCRQLELPVGGLMCIPPQDANPAPHFALLREIARRNGVSGLSMGMSGDFETAIRMGATSVRIGTSIFGPRA